MLEITVHLTDIYIFCGYTCCHKNTQNLIILLYSAHDKRASYTKTKKKITLFSFFLGNGELVDRCLLLLKIFVHLLDMILILPVLQLSVPDSGRSLQGCVRWLEGMSGGAGK